MRERRPRRRKQNTGAHPRDDTRNVVVYRESRRTGQLYMAHTTGDNRPDVISIRPPAGKPRGDELPGREYFLLQELLLVLQTAHKAAKRKRKRSLRPPAMPLSGSRVMRALNPLSAGGLR